MTRSLLALLLTSITAAPLFAQGKDMGPAAQHYQQKTPRFHFVPGPRKEGGEISVDIPQNAHVEWVRDEYAILQPDVTVKYQDITVRADKMTINYRTKDVVGEGHVIIDQGPIRMTAQQVIFNLDSKTGTFFTATAALQPDMYFTGDKIEKTGDTNYRLTNGVMTSCDLDRPSWSFHVQSADINLNDYAHMRGVSFRAHEIPILYAPVLLWPTKHERSQGLLIPRLTLSREFGTRLDLGYFMPFGESVDATVYADLNSASYFGAGVNFRYRPSEDVKLGDLNAYTVHDVRAKREQWKYTYQHSQDNLPGGFRGVVDVEDFSNLDFFRRYDRDPRLHTLSQIYSSAYLTRNRPTYSFNVLTDRRDIVGFASSEPNQPPDRQRFEQLPSLQLRMYPNRIGNTPLYFSLESSLSHLATSGLINGPTANYFRGDFFPTLSLQLRTPAWFSIRPQLSVRDTWYSQSLNPNAAANGLGSLPASRDAIQRFYAQGQVEVVGPSFSRVYNDAFAGFTKFKHVIEPRFRYLYTSNVNDQDRVIRFDTVDTPFLPIVRDSVEYSLTQRVIGREAGPNSSSREVLSFALRQSVSLSRPFTQTTGGNLPGSSVTPGANNKFTPLVASLHVNPYQSITFDANTTFGNVTKRIQQSSVSANLVGTGVNADKYLSFTYFASYKDRTQQADFSASQIRLNSGASLLRDRIRADVQLNYDARNGKFLEQRYLIGGTAACYGIALEFRRFLVYVPFEKADFSAGIAVTLKNVGTIGTH
ncbi:MAG: LPS assembly protein LptD [Thermoanaerobaculia bacterium]